MSLVSTSSSLRTQHFPHPSHNDSHCVGVISSRGVCCQKNSSSTIYPGNCLLSSRCNGAPAAWRYYHGQAEAVAVAPYQLVPGKNTHNQQDRISTCGKNAHHNAGVHGNICKKCAAPMLERRHIPAGENIFIDPSFTAAGCAAENNRMHKGQTIGGQQSGDTGKIAG